MILNYRLIIPILIFSQVDYNNTQLYQQVDNRVNNTHNNKEINNGNNNDSNEIGTTMKSINEDKKEENNKNDLNNNHKSNNDNDTKYGILQPEIHKKNAIFASTNNNNLYSKSPTNHFLKKTLLSFSHNIDNSYNHIHPIFD